MGGAVVHRAGADGGISNFSAIVLLKEYLNNIDFFQFFSYFKYLGGSSEGKKKLNTKCNQISPRISKNSLVSRGSDST